MTIVTEIAPPNSLLLVMDKDSGEIPESMEGKLIVATPSCIAVGTLSAADGRTSVMLTDERVRIQGHPGLRRVFSGVLATPKKEVDLCTVLLQPVLNTQSNLEIWANDESEPDRLCVLVAD
ncbi:MAG TPA: hypothetical protein VMP11_05345 [Verrucomicrobiae bacterium]|nr:hypothetical protein [Verrucomicrobiae bacterium]